MSIIHAYKRVCALFLSLPLSISVSRSHFIAFLSFDFDCYYAIIEIKIEAGGYPL